MKTMNAVVTVLSGASLGMGAVCFGLLGWWVAVPMGLVALAMIGHGVGGVIVANL